MSSQDSSKAQLEYRLKLWGFKQKLDKKTWRYIDHRIDKRNRAGKGSEIILCGRRLKASTVKKGTYRDRGLTYSQRPLCEFILSPHLVSSWRSTEMLTFECSAKPRAPDRCAALNLHSTTFPHGVSLAGDAALSSIPKHFPALVPVNSLRIFNLTDAPQVSSRPFFYPVSHPQGKTQNRKADNQRNPWSLPYWASRSQISSRAYRNWLPPWRSPCPSTTPGSISCVLKS